MSPQELVRARRTRKPPEQRRQELLDAALGVFADKGVERATIEDITAAAGVAKGTFYLYFESKEQLIAGLYERLVGRTLEHAQALLAKVGTGDWWALVDATIEAFVDFTLEHRIEFEMFWTQSITREAKGILEACDRKLVEMFAWAIRSGAEAGAFSVTDPDMMASLLVHAMNGALEHAVLYGRVERDRLIAGALEFSRKALSPMPQASRLQR